MVVHTFHPSAQEAETGGSRKEFEASLGCMILSQKYKKVGVMVHAFNCSIREAETGEFEVRQGYIVRP